MAERLERVVLVTGSTDGIGRQAARTLAAGGMKVIVHGRSKAKVEATLAALRDELPGGDLDGVAFDLGSLASVRRGADEVLAKAPRLHVLVNNAGIFATERVLSADQIELTLAVNVVGPYALTEKLLPRLVESAREAGQPSRVIDVASMAHQRGVLDPAEVAAGGTGEQGWTGYAAYASSKLANIMHALALADRFDPKELVAYSLHPGVIQTKLLRQGFGPVRGASVESGARAIVRLAGEDEAHDPSGTYFADGVATPPASAARDAAGRGRVMDAISQLSQR